MGRKEGSPTTSRGSGYRESEKAIAFRVLYTSVFTHTYTHHKDCRRLTAPIKMKWSSLIPRSFPSKFYVYFLSIPCSAYCSLVALTPLTVFMHHNVQGRLLSSGMWHHAWAKHTYHCFRGKWCLSLFSVSRTMKKEATDFSEILAPMY